MHTYPWLLPLEEKENKPQRLEVITNGQFYFTSDDNLSFHKQKMQKQDCVLLLFQWMGRSVDLPSLTVALASLPGHHSAPTNLHHLHVASRGHNLDLVIVCDTFCAPISLSCSSSSPQCSCSAAKQKPCLQAPFPPEHPCGHPYSVELFLIYCSHFSHLALLLSVLRIPSPSFVSPATWTLFNEIKAHHLHGDESRDGFF